MTSILLQSNVTPDKLVAEARTVLQAGGIVVLPTDTVPGIGCLANNKAGIKKLFELKNRPADLAIPVILADAADIRHYSLDLSTAFIKLAESFWPGPLTLVVASNGKIDPAVGGGLATLGFRVPNFPLLRSIVKASGFPMALTSANPHNLPPSTSHDTLLTWWDGKVDLIILGDPRVSGPPSTVVDVTDDPPIVLREGSLRKAQILKALSEKIPDAE
jgi:L-threonylcarbamoyladenylate synthase